MALVLLPASSGATRPGWRPIVETAIDVARDAGGLSFDGPVLNARGQLCIEPRTPPYLAGVVATVRALSAQTCDRCGGPGDPVHVAGHPFPTTRCAACRARADALLPRPRWRRDRDVERERVAVRRALLIGGVRTLPVVEDVVGDEDLAALMDARYRPAEHVGWPRTLVGEEHGLPIWTIEHAGWNALLRAAFTLLLPLQCEGQAASLRVTQVKERYGRLVIHVRACDPFLPGLVRFFRAHSAKVCIRCGGRGTLRDGDDVGWVRPECDRCWSVRPARA